MTTQIEPIEDSYHLFISIEAKEGYQQKVLSLLYATIVPTHKEEGCLEYKLFNKGKLIIIKGAWKTKMSLDLHLLLQFHLSLFEDTLPKLCENIDIQILHEIEPPITSLSIST